MEEKDSECTTLHPKHALGTYFKYLVGAMVIDTGRPLVLKRLCCTE